MYLFYKHLSGSTEKSTASERLPWGGLLLYCMVRLRLSPSRSQLFFLFLPHTLNCALPFHSLRLRLEFLAVNQLYRPSRPGILSARSGVMRPKPFLYIIRPSRIQGSVPAPEYIRIIHALLLSDPAQMYLFSIHYTSGRSNIQSDTPVFVHVKEF